MRSPGIYPESLDRLLPNYVQDIPDTRNAGWPEDDYSISHEQYAYPFDNYRVLVGFCFAPSDRKDLIYWPDQNYPDSEPRFVRRIGEWAYVEGGLD